MSLLCSFLRQRLFFHFLNGCQMTESTKKLLVYAFYRETLPPPNKSFFGHIWFVGRYKLFNYHYRLPLFEKGVRQEKHLVSDQTISDKNKNESFLPVKSLPFIGSSFAFTYELTSFTKESNHMHLLNLNHLHLLSSSSFLFSPSSASFSSDGQLC